MSFLPLVGAALWVLLMTNDKPLSRDETETRVKEDLAARLKVEASEVKVDDAVDREWRDETLGCGARKGLAEPVAVPGYEFRLSHGDKTFVYHSDRRGRFMRCDPPPKPIDRIRR